MAKNSMNGLPVGNLTPRSNTPEVEMRYTGSFGQPDGFGSILDVKVYSSGELCLKIHNVDADGKSRSWAVQLTSEQRKHLAATLIQFEPVLWEEIKE